jgi:cell division protein FtsZ
MADDILITQESIVTIPKIKVIGVGGGGSNAVSRMYRDRLTDIEYIVVNTDLQALIRSDVPVRLQVGAKAAKGLGAGGDPDKGRECAEESREGLKKSLEGSDMIFIASGMGGGSGTGGAPIVAEVAKEVGALTVGVVTKPFSFEGSRRMRTAEAGITALKDKVDTLIIIPNDRLLVISDPNTTMEAGFRMADDILRHGVQSIVELITTAGEINVDFADIRAVMGKAGPAWMAIGHGSGEHRAIEAAENAINSPLLEVSLEGAKGILFNITGGTDLTVSEVHAAAEVIAKVAHPDANIFFGMVNDRKIDNEVTLTLIATGFPQDETSEHNEGASDLQATLVDQTSLDLPPFLRHHPAARRRLKGEGPSPMARPAQAPAEPAKVKQVAD